MNLLAWATWITLLVGSWIAFGSGHNDTGVLLSADALVILAIAESGRR